MQVRGIVSGIERPYLISELTDHRDEAPLFWVKAYGRDWDNLPHQKLVVIDGLMAFKGSANLTVSGWRKAAKDRDVVEVTTNVDEVIALNNRYFSPVWKELSDVGDSIKMDIIPF
jgi:hypothetical protein